MPTSKLLDDAEVAQGSVILTQDGEVANPAPIFQQDLISSAKHYYSDKVRGAIFGRCADVDNILRTVWDGSTALYVFPTGPQQMKFVSTSAQDGPAGTGILSIALRYLDNNYVEKQEIVTLNGTTAVNTVATNILRVNGIRANTVGSASGQAVGNISLTNMAGSVTYGYLASGGNSARQAVYTVPLGKVAYISYWSASCGSTGEHFTRFVLTATARDGVLIRGVFLVQDEIILQNNSGNITFPTPIMLPELCDIQITTISDNAAANVAVAASAGGWIETK